MGSLTALMWRALLLLWPTALLAQPCPKFIPSLDYQLVASHPHDRSAFTQGLLFADGVLYESSGGYGKSWISRQPPQGPAQRQALPDYLFAEGLAMLDEQLWLLSWKAGELRRYDPQTLSLLERRRYRGEGWGLTSDGQRFYMSDGSAKIRVRRPPDFTVEREMTVRTGAQPLPWLNELEWIEGQIFANLWQTDRIARIDPANGCVTGWLDLHALWPRQQRSADADVLNGIAWHAASGHLWVTGKRWPLLYELRLSSP